MPQTPACRNNRRPDGAPTDGTRRFTRKFLHSPMRAPASSPTLV